MEQIVAELEVKLKRFIQHAKIIMWLSIVSILNPPLYLIVLLYFLIYNYKLSQLKHIQPLNNIAHNLINKSTKELKYTENNGEPSEQRFASLLIAHKSMIKALIITGTIIVIVISVITFFNLL